MPNKCPSALTDTLVNLEGRREKPCRGFFYQSSPFGGNIPPVSAGVRLFNQERLFSTIWYEFVDFLNYHILLARLIFQKELGDMFIQAGTCTFL